MLRFLMSAVVLWAASVSAVDAETPKSPERAWAVHRLNNVPAADAATAISGLLRAQRAAAPKSDAPRVPVAIVVAEPTTNSLLISAPPDAIAKIEAVISRLDIPRPMVRIELMIVELAKTTPSTKPATSSEVSRLSAQQLKRVLGLVSPDAVADANDVDQRLSALSQEGHIRIVRRPQLLTLSGQAAQLVIGQNEPCITGVSTTPHGQQNSITYREVGLILTATPQVAGDGMVAMEISLTDSHVEPTDQRVLIARTKEQSVHAPRVITTEAQSVVRLRNGQTTVLGGVATGGHANEPERLILITANVISN